jgi:hypothetical protein
MSLHLGSVAPPITQESTECPISFHEWLGGYVGSLQLTDNHQAATPADWQDGDGVVIMPSLQDPKELAERFPKGFKAVRPYLRLTPQPNQ